MATTNEIKYKFKRSDGAEWTLTQPFADTSGKSDAEITAAGESILAAGLFEPDGFALSEYVGAEKIVTTTTDVPYDAGV